MIYLLKILKQRSLYSNNNLLARFFSSEFNLNNVRVRFAPSPTGFLHLGGLRTALYNYLFAKSQKGKFILRIEDTDQTRIVPGAIQQLLEDLQWVGLELDEGPTIGGNYGSYIQSERTDIYKEEVNKLLENGWAYHCFCTERRLDMLRREALRTRQIPKYDNRCRTLDPNQVKEKLAKGENYCIRFKLSNDCATFEDIVFGNIAYDVTVNEGDPVIIKADGFPTYHFANVVDDHYMKISHVLRGVEWQISTTKHILLYRALNWTPPVFGHLPLLLNSDGSKLSKRQGDIQISNYKNAGIFPNALLNFVTFAGGGFNRDSGLKNYTLPELVDLFEIQRINSNSTRLMPEKLIDFNRLELMDRIKNDNTRKQLIPEVKQLVVNKFLKEYESNLLQLHNEHIESVLLWARTRIYKLSDLVTPNLSFLWVLPTLTELTFDEQLSDVALSLQIMLKNEHSDLHKDSLVPMLKDFALEKDISYKELMKFLRLVLSGLKQGPGVAEMIEILGKEETISRLENYTRKINI